MRSKTSDGEKNSDLFARNAVEMNANSTISAVNLYDLLRDNTVNGVKIFALIDSGPQLNILPRYVVPHLNVSNSQTKIYAWGRFPIIVAGVSSRC